VVSNLASTFILIHDLPFGISSKMDEDIHRLKLDVQSDLDTTRLYTTRTSVIRGFFQEVSLPPTAQLFRVFELL
jgi:hypothetical protein